MSQNIRFKTLVLLM